jgi:hypothetical protein
MRVVRISLSFVLVFPNLLPAAPRIPKSPQQASTISSSAPVTLQQSLAALVGNTLLTDVTLSGSARRIAGSDDETGTATLKANFNGSARLDFVFPSGPSSEVSNLSAGAAGSWSGPDTASHPIAFHNLLAEQAWFSPAIAISRRLGSSGYTATYIGREVLDEQTVEHISVLQAAPLRSPPDAATFEHLSQVDFYLDSATLLPVSISFNIHPDNNALQDIPVEVRFSDYRLVSGSRIPFHIQKFINGTLALDLQIQAATINSGLSASAFNIQ